jgi:hypothetical protein
MGWSLMLRLFKYGVLRELFGSTWERVAGESYITTRIMIGIPRQYY